MATIIFSAVGNAFGGPIGGTIGAILGNQLDQLVFKTGKREGPRLKELQVTTSSYGTPVARHFGRVRTAGSIIWSTDLIEDSEKSGGGKKQPSTTTYSYSCSFAVALASRPIVNIGRIWADGNLLRGLAGDLKTGGTLRIYRGYGDQEPDPLIQSDKGEGAPAFRGLAYCVFESLQLADFGNRIPTLTFEIFADDGQLSLTQVVPELDSPLEIERPLPDLAGFSHESGSLALSLRTISQIYPLYCSLDGEVVTIAASDAEVVDVHELPEAASAKSGDGFAEISGASSRRKPDLRDIPDGLRYYDLERDFQAGLQRADGRARYGRSLTMEFPGVISAEAARELINRAVERAASSKESILWRLPELDPSLSPGVIVQIPGRKGLWQIEDWEWLNAGIELQLLRLPHGPSRRPPADAGASLAQIDLPIAPTLLSAFELPWDGTGSGTQRQVFAAATSVTAGWAGASIYAVDGDVLTLLGSTGKLRTVSGKLILPLPPGDSHLIARSATIDVALEAEDLSIPSATLNAIANGANRALVGGEIIQFASATRLSEKTWRLTGLLRGRGGTERQGLETHPAGTAFVLLDGNPTSIDPIKLGNSTTLAAVGLADSDPVLANVIESGRTLRPLPPVHPVAKWSVDGALNLGWTRRSRGSYSWLDLVDVPLNEQTERYIVGVGNTGNPYLHWDVTEPRISLAGATIASLRSSHPGAPVWVRQSGSFSASEPLLLHTIA